MTRFSGKVIYNRWQEVRQSSLTVTLYLDVYLAANMLADLVVLKLLKKLLRLPGKERQMMFGAAFGSAAACGWLLLWRLPFPAKILYQMASGALMLRIAFGKTSMYEFVQRYVGLWMTAAVTEGMLELILEDQNRSFLALLAGITVVYYAGTWGGTFLRKQQSLQKNLYEVTLCFQERRVETTALLDSGNRLYEPYTHQPVHVITKEIAKKLCKNCNIMVYIPFTSLGAEHGMMRGFRIDEMEVRKDGRLIRKLERPWVGISGQPLSGRHQYEMLLHGEE